MGKKIITILLILAVVILPFVGWFAGSLFTPPVYHNTFLAGLSGKYERLTSVESPKIVVVGGSSVAFGLDSQQMEEHLQRPVVNFGLYASLGSKVMLDLSRSAIQAGDLVVLAFELDNQTLSEYFNAESMWQAVDCDPALLLRIDGEDYPAMLGGWYNYAQSKALFRKNGVPDPEGVYNKASFDEWGDVCYPRPKNVMPARFDTNNIIDLKSVCVEESFAEHVNQYVRSVEKKGAQVCFSFCPMNQAGMTSLSEAEKDGFVEHLDTVFDCPIISEMDDYILESKYFYDTNFHLNDNGVFLRTQRLAKDIDQYFDIGYVDVKPPFEDNFDQTEEDDPSEDVSNSDFAHCFLYENFYDIGLAITGVTEAAKEYTELTIPTYYNGQKIMAIKEGALKECSRLTTLYIACKPEDSITLYSGAFSGVLNLKSVVLDAEPTCIKISTEGLLDGAGEDVTFYVAKERYGKYVTDYYWAIYSEKIKLKK